MGTISICVPLPHTSVRRQSAKFHHYNTVGPSSLGAKALMGTILFCVPFPHTSVRWQSVNFHALDAYSSLHFIEVHTSEYNLINNSIRL